MLKNAEPSTSKQWYDIMGSGHYTNYGKFLPALSSLEKNYISAPRQNFRYPSRIFFGLNMMGLDIKFQLSSFKTEGGV